MWDPGIKAPAMQAVRKQAADPEMKALNATWIIVMLVYNDLSFYLQKIPLISPLPMTMMMTMTIALSFENISDIAALLVWGNTYL